MSTLWSLPPEFVLVAIVLGLSLLVGVPLIRFGVWLPREVETQTLPDAALSDAQRAYYQPLDLALQASGFSPRLNFAVVNFPGPTLSRVYMADHDHAVLAAHLMRSHGAFDVARPTSHNYMEWITKYQDGTTLYTRNAQVSSVFTALRGVWNFFNPFTDNFTPLRFLIGVLVGVGLPAVAAWLTTPEAAYRPPGVPVWNVTAPLRLAVLAAAYTIAGAAVGWIFALKTFIWATLLGYLPLRVLTPHPRIELLLPLWMAMVAERAAAIRNRREMLV